MAFANVSRILIPKLPPMLALVLFAGLGACTRVTDLLGDQTEEQVAGEHISVLTLEEELVADSRIADMPVTLPRAYTNMQWPQPGGGPTNSMQHLELEGEFDRVWRSSAGAGNNLTSRMTASPVMANNKVFVLNALSQVTAFDAETGDRIWRTRVRAEGEARRSGFGGGVAHAGDRLIVTTGFGAVHALDDETGEELWRRDVGVPIRTAPTFVNGRAFVVTTDNQLLAIDTRDGAVVWSHRAFDESAGLLAATSPAANADVVIAPFTSGELDAIRIQTGNSAWSDQLTRTGNFTPLANINAIAARPVIANGRVYAVSHSGRFVSIDLRTGERVWSANIASTQTPWVAGQFIYVVTVDAQLICLSARDGHIRWITQMDQYRSERRQRGAIQYVGPVLVSDRLVVLTSEGRMQEYSPFTGEFIDDTRVGSTISLPPIVANKTLYILTDNARLSAFRGEGLERARREAREGVATPASAAPSASNEEDNDDDEDGGRGWLRWPWSSR